MPRRAESLAKQAVETMFQRFQHANPAPKTELNYTNAYTLLVAVVLSAQATDASVNRATAGLFKTVDTPDKMLKLGEARLRDVIRTIGLYRTKAKNVIALSQILQDTDGGEVPRTREALQALPGVGRKTANVVLNTFYGEHTMAVDTHVFRVANRTGLAPGANPLQVEEGLLKRIPAPYLRNAHHWLILHGRYVCTARKPHCPACLVRDLCLFEPKTKEV